MFPGNVDNYHSVLYSTATVHEEFFLAIVVTAGRRVYTAVTRTDASIPVFLAAIPVRFLLGYRGAPGRSMEPVSCPSRCCPRR